MNTKDPEKTAPVIPTAMGLFLLYGGISAVTIGGGYAIVPVMGRALEKKGWMDEDLFQSFFARAQAFPGPIALSTAILTARNIASQSRPPLPEPLQLPEPLRSSSRTQPFHSQSPLPPISPTLATAAAIAGIVLPPFLALVLVGSALGTIGSLPVVVDFLHGAGATVPGLVGAMLLKTARKRKWNPPRILATLILTILLVAFPAASLPVLLGGIALGYAGEKVVASWKS